MAMYFPTVDKDSLQASNPFYTALQNAIDAFEDAQDDFWQSRENYWDAQGKNTSKSEVVARYEDKIGEGNPWNYRSRFNNINPRRTDDGKTAHVRVSADFLAASGAPREELLQEIPTGTPGSPSNPRYEPYDPPRYAASMIGGDPGADTLWTNIDLFEDRGNDVTYYIDRGGDDPVAQIVYDEYDEVPYAWEDKSGFEKEALQLMYFVGQAWHAACDNAYDDYRDVLSDYNSSGGGDIDEDYFSGNPDRPWDDYEGDRVEYMRSNSLPAVLVREIRGEN